MFCLVSVVLGCGNEKRAFPQPSEGLLESAEAVRDGEQLYQRNCAICHGPAAHGNGPQARNLRPAPADLRSLHGVRADPGYWFYRIQQGGKVPPLARDRSAMPGWGDHLSDEEIWHLVAYLSALRDAKTPTWR